MLTSLLVGLALAQEPYVHTLPVKRDHLSKAEQHAARERVTALLTDVEQTVSEGDPARAEPGAWMAAELAIRAFGDNDPLTMTALNDLGSVLDSTGNYEVAGVALQRSLDARLALFGLGHPGTALAYANLGEHNRTIGDYTTARFDLEQAVAIARVIHGENAVETIVYATHLAGVLEALGADVDQKLLLDWCLAVQEQSGRWKTAETAQCAADLGDLLVVRGDLVMGRIRAEQGLALGEVAYGPEHPAIALYVLTLAKSREAEGRFVEANALLDRTLHLQETAYGNDSPILASALSGRATVAIQLGRFADADRDSARAIELIVAALGPEHPDLAALYANRGVVLAQLGRIPEALAAFDRAATIPGADSAEATVGAEMGRGQALMLSSRTAEAAAIFKRAWDVSKAALGPADPTTLIALLNLAGAEYRLGRLGDATAHIEELLAATDSEATHNPLEAGRRLNAAAAILGTTGETERALGLLDRALVIQEASLGVDHPDVGHTLVNRCRFEDSRADFVHARDDCDRALAIAEKALGADSPDVAEVLETRASVRASLGDAPAAEADARRALTIRQATLGPDAPEVAESRILLAQLTMDRDDPGAIQELRAALTTLERVYDPGDWRLASPHIALGARLAHSGQLDLAIAELEGARSLLEASPAESSIDVAMLSLDIGNLWLWQGRHAEAAVAFDRAEPVLTPLGGALLSSLMISRAELYAVTGRMDEAHVAAQTAVALQRQDLADLMASLSDRERRAAVANHRFALDVWLSIGTDDVADQWAATMGWKGLATRAASSLRAETSPEDSDLRKLRAQISTLAYDPDAEGRSERLLALTAEKDRLERSAAAGQAPQTADTFDPMTICKALSDHTAIVDVLRYNHVVGLVGDARYLAYVAEPGSGTCTITRVDLGPADAIDKAIERWRSLVAADVSTSRIDTQGTALRKLVWDPIARTTTAKAVWLVPDGALATVPFAGLPIGGGRYLVHERTISYLDHASDVSRRPARATGGALVVGGVDFGESLPAPGACVSSLQALPGTATEADAIATSLTTAGMSVKRLGGRDATEGHVRDSLGNLRVAHIATHGFFASSSCRTASSDSRAMAMGLADTDLIGGFDPMVLSGMAFAGANARDDDGGDDGLLTAEELANVDLNGTDLVVMSACESGLGQIAEGEGVLGLRRGFALAGADGVVMSMWEVDDAVTMRLMELFYEHLLGKDAMSASEALRQAEITVMAERLAATGEARPQDWAPFIASGPGTLR